MCRYFGTKHNVSIHLVQLQSHTVSSEAEVIYNAPARSFNLAQGSEFLIQFSERS